MKGEKVPNVKEIRVRTSKHGLNNDSLLIKSFPKGETFSYS